MADQPTAADRALRVLVVALTYKRLDDLSELIPALVDHARDSDEDVRILVADNDPAAGAEGQVMAFSLQHPVDYVHVPEPGIAAARNAALARAQDYDLLVFIDDDERPAAGWLAHLVATYRRFGSAAVVGPVVSRYAVTPEPWILAGRFFDRRRLTTGTVVDLAATNNLLLDVAQVRDLDLTFDERFGLSGGSDTLFTRQLHARGGVMIWCDEAIVLDIVPQHRLTRKWVIQRAFRSGNTWMRTSLEMTTSQHTRQITRLNLASRGAVRVVAGTARFVVGALTLQMGQRARGIRTIARGAGLVSGSVGSVYSEYKRL